jgi:uncharacterized membrane protein
MHDVLVFDDKAKKRIGWICFAPVIAFLITFLYYGFLLLPLTSGHVQTSEVVGITSQNYDTLLLMFGVSAVIATAVLIYNIVLIARVRNMKAQQKLIWIMILCIFVPITTIIFWNFVIRKEQRYVSTYADIA